jgi:bla regulator protein blaR1
MNAIADHLWQSTIFAGIVWLLTLALRKNRARVRHSLWLAASFKFLIPFSVFIALGSQVHWRTAPITAPANINIVMDQVTQPFTAPAVVAMAPPAPSLLPSFLLAVWACGFIGITCAWWVRWRRILAAVRAGSPVQLDLPIRAMSSSTLLEPGVFGIFRPILLLPEGIFDRLTSAQLQAVIAHELCHVRHRDNLVASIHMFVETVFWFHPLVWWIGKRMVEERERACDEEVLREFGEPKVYAEGILSVCKLYVESPLACVSGVTGSNLKKRIEAIMTDRVALGLNLGKRAALAVAALTALALPIVVGMMHAQTPAAARPKFEVASVKPNGSDGASRMDRTPGGLTATDADFNWLLEMAFQTRLIDWSHVPESLRFERYDVIAKAAEKISGDQYWEMLQTLLEDRFKLTFHREIKDAQVYSLVLAKKGTNPGPKLSRSVNAECPVNPDGGNFCGVLSRPGMMVGQRVSMARIARELSPFAGRPVQNETGLTGSHDFQLTWTPDPGEYRADGDKVKAAGIPVDPSGPSFFSAIKEQLGLKLESKKGQVEILVIDHVERPTDN